MKKSAVVGILINFLFVNTGFAQIPTYTDVAQELGIDHTYLLNNSGGGVSFYDFDGDGKDDITLATGVDEKVQFYRNNGNGFDPIDLGIEDVQNQKSVLWVDFDNDGDKDFYIAAFDGINKLYEQTDEGSFTDITEESGLSQDSVRSFGAIWGDYNRDGHLDLYYTARASGINFGVTRNRLFKNQGNGTFEEVSYEVGAADEGRLPFCAAFFDYNGDKWPDIYIANDRKKRNTLLKNSQGQFTDVSVECQADVEIDAMNTAIGDIDNNGLQDIYVTNTPEGSALLTCSYEQEEYIFMDEADERGVGFYGIGWGANFLDIDNDGWKDLYVSGMLIGAGDIISSSLFRNDGSGYFSEVDQGLEGDTVRSFTNAVGDWNDDGYPDIMVSNSEYYNSQLWSSSGGDANWLKVGLEGVISNRDGVGTTIEVFADGLYQHYYTHCGLAFMGQNADYTLIGMADIEVVDSLRMIWPTGHIDRLYDIEVNQKLHVLEGSTTDGNINIDSDIILSNNETTMQNLNIEVFPNPVAQILSIKGAIGNISYTIIDLSGSVIASGTGKHIDVSRFHGGLYIIEIHDRNGSRTLPISIVE